MAERRDDKSQDEGVLARWSRRKQAARVGEPEQPAETRLPAEGEPEAPAGAPAAEEPPDLPDPETLDAGSDFRPFLRPGVPVEKHRAALRRLWRLDPFYSRHDGLSDYCEDFSDQATTLKGIRTAWRVGRGLLDQVDKAAEPRVAGSETASTESAPDSGGAAVEPASAEPGSSQEKPRTGRRLPKPI